MSWFRRAFNRSFSRPTPALRRSRRSLSELVRLDDRIVPASDLTITATPLAGPITAGTNVTFQYTIENIDVEDATDVELISVLPAGLTFVSIAQTGGDALFTLDSDFDNTVLSTLWLFKSGQSAVLEITAKVDANVLQGAKLSSTAKVESSSFEPNLLDNEVTVDVDIVTKADLSISINGPNSGGSGDQLDYVVTIVNTGPSDAQNVSFTEDYGTGLIVNGKTYVSGSMLPGIVPAGGSATYNVSLSVPSAVTDGFHNLSVTVASDTSDPVPANDTNSIKVNIQGRSLTANVVSGQLVITDVVGRANDLTITRDGANLVISDVTERFQTSSAGVVSKGNRTITIPIAGLNKILVSTGGGNDGLTINSETAIGIPITFDGGLGNDLLTVNGGNGQTVSSNFIDASSGSVVIAGGDSVNYTGLEPVLLNFGSATDYIFNLPAMASAATLEDGAVAGTSKLTGATFEDTEFTTTGIHSITINRGHASDTLSVRSLPDFTGTLTVGSAVLPFATVSVTDAVTTVADLTVHSKAINIDANVTTSGNLSLNAGDSLTFMSGKQTTVPAGKIFNLSVGGLGSLGGTLSFVGADFIAPNGVSVSGGPNADSIRVTKTTAAITLNGDLPATAPGDTLIVDGSAGNAFEYRSPSTFSLGGGGLVSFSNFEATPYENISIYNIIGTAADDKLELNENVSLQAQFKFNTDPTVVLPAGIATFGFFGGSGNDRMFLTAANAGNWPVPMVNFDGQSGNDGLSLHGKSQNGTRQDVTLTLAPVVGNLGRGTAMAGTATLNFDRLEPIDLFGVDDAQVTFAGKSQMITVSEGKDFFHGGATPALRIEGTTDGLAFETVAVWSNSSLFLNAVSAPSGIDTVSFTGATNAHLNDTLRITTDLDAGSGVAITGAITVAQDVKINTAAITISNNVTATSGQLDLAHTGTMTLGTVNLKSGTTFSQSSGEVIILNMKSATVESEGSATFNGLVNGPGSLRVNSVASGTFTKDVGTVRLLNLTTNPGGTTTFQGAFVKTDANQTFGDDVTFATSGFTFDSLSGSINHGQRLNPANAGLNVTFSAPNGDVTHASTIGDLRPVGTYLVSNAQNVNLNGMTGTNLYQTSGSGQTKVGGTVTLSGTTPGAADFTTGGAINLKTNDTAFTGTVIADNAPVVLQLANGATQPSGSLSTTQLYLNGAGSFAINQKANALNGDGKGEVFAKITSGSISVVDSTNLRLEFFDPVIPVTAIAISGGADRSVLLQSARDLSIGMIPANYDKTLIDVTDTGTVQFYFGTVAGGTYSPGLFAQIRANTTKMGLPLGQPPLIQSERGNTFTDTFSIRPQLKTDLSVFGNNPHLTPSGDAIDLVVDGIGSLTPNPLGNGDGTISFSAPYRTLRYFSIEEFLGTNVSAFTVQTRPSVGKTENGAFGIAVQFTNNGSQITNSYSGLQQFGNPFIVAPERVDPNQPYRSPSITFANISGKNSQDLVVVGGPNAEPIVTVIRLNPFGSTVNLSKLTPSDIVAQFVAFESTFRGGLDVAAGDLNGDGFDELVIGAGPTGGPRVVVAQLATSFGTILPTPAILHDFFAYEPSFRGGVNVAVADVNGDGKHDIVAGAGVGGGPRIRVFNGAVGPTAVLADFFAYDPGYRGGVNVTGGRFTDHLTRDQVVAAPGQGGGPHIQIFDGLIPGNKMESIRSFFAWSDDNKGLIPGQSESQLGVGDIALASSATNNGHNQFLLVSRPRGQSFKIDRFANVDGGGAAIFDPTRGVYVDRDFHVDIDGTSYSYRDLIDGGTVGGLAN